MLLLRQHLVEQLQRHQVLIGNHQLVDRFVLHDRRLLCQVTLLHLVQQLYYLVILLPLILLLHYQVRNIEKGEEVLVEDAFSPDDLSEIPEEVKFDLEGACLVVENALEILDFEDGGGVGDETEEVVDDLFFVLVLLFVLAELVVVDDARDDLLLLYVEVVLELLEDCPQLLAVLKHASVQPLALLRSLLPRLQLLSQLRILLLYQFHIKCSTQILFFLIPLVKDVV